MTQEQAVELLMRVHYSFFMTNPRFWYDKNLLESDKLIVVAASDIRKELKVA